MTSKKQYSEFVKALNYGSVRDVMGQDELVMHVSLEARAMSPSDAKAIISDLIKEGKLKKVGSNIDLRGLYDPSERRYVMKGKSGRTLKSKLGTTGLRTVNYVGPGHTQVDYNYRKLDIYFKETPKEFKAKVLRAKNKGATVDTVYVGKDIYGNTTYTNRSGRKVDSKKKTDKGKRAIVKKNLKRDKYTVEEMRAMLNDDHWEEVSGNRKWNYDNATLIREFNKYLRRKI